MKEIGPKVEQWAALFKRRCRGGVRMGKYDRDEMTEFGEGFKAGIICTALVLFILWLVAFVSYDLGKAASRDAQSKLSEEVRT